MGRKKNIIDVSSKSVADSEVIRPTKFNETLKNKICEMASAGKTDDEIADAIKVSRATLKIWKGKHPNLLAALKDAKQVADELVEATLFQKAIGYSHKAVKIFQHEGESFEHEYIEHYAPDTVAAIFWLKNRRPDLWRDKQPDEGAININILNNMSDEQLNEKIRVLEEKLGGKPKR